MIKHVHRRIVNEDGYYFLHQIGYSFTDEGLVDIHEIAFHIVDEYGILGPNIITTTFDKHPYEMRLSSLNTLIEDGIIELP